MYKIYTGCRVTDGTSEKVAILNEKYRIKFFRTKLCSCALDQDSIELLEDVPLEI